MNICNEDVAELTMQVCIEDACSEYIITLTFSSSASDNLLEVNEVE